MDQSPTKFVNLEGIVKKLDTSLHLRKWTKYFACFEDDALNFYRTKTKGDMPESTVDLTFVTSLKLQGYSPNPKEDEQFQIEIQSPGVTNYLLFESKDEQNRWFTAIKYCVDHFMADTPHGSLPTQSSMPDLTGPDKDKFVISNSEKKNQDFLKSYYAMNRSRAGLGPLPPGGPGAPAPANPAAASSSLSRAPSDGLSKGSSDSAEKVRKLEDLLRQIAAERDQQDKVEQALRTQLAEKDNEWKKKEADLISSFETKRKSFNFLVASKDQELEKLKHETQVQFTRKIQTLEEILSAKDKELTDIKQRLSDKELEVLELREKEFEKSSRQEHQAETAMKDAHKKITELTEQLTQLSDRHFFALALQVKMQTNNGSLDLNGLYDEAKREKVPVAQWQTWISQKITQSDGSAAPAAAAATHDDEKEDVDGF